MTAAVRRLLLIALTSAGVLCAQDDGPGRGVARISVINGDVSVRRGDSGDFVAAAVNAPLVVGDRVFTGGGSRAEIQLDYANLLRMSYDAEVRLSELEYKRYQIQIARGTVTFRVLRDYDTQVDLSTPSVSVRPVHRGEYRITVHDDGSSEITVRSGEAEIFTPRGSERMRPGRTMVARGTASDPEFQFAAAVREDDWDRWNERRDRDLERSRSYQYVSRDIYGAEDLDDHGRWISTPDYGWVWSPRAAAGWAPYRHGRWVWIDYYGWSWVSYDPWGWAPYHYGRWFHRPAYGWCWWPGGIGVRHYWSPALVAFFGFGRVSVGLGWGNVGWVPLAPYDPFQRWWGPGYYGGYRNRTFVNNSVQIVNITNVYRNARITNAVTAVDQDSFSRGRVAHVVRVSDGDLRAASTARGPVPIAPDRASLRMADRELTSTPRATGDDRRFFSPRQIANVDRVPFDDQRRGVQEISRRSFGDAPREAAAVEGRRGAADNAHRTEAADNGWRRVGESPRGSAEAVDRGAARRTEENGWRRFGEPITGTAAGSRLDAGPSPRRTESVGEAGSWRRFGEPGGADRGVVGRGTDRSADSGSSRRPAQIGGTPDRALEDRNEGRRQSGDGSWRRFEQRAPESRSAGGNESIRMSPPMIRDRSGPDTPDRSGLGRQERMGSRGDAGAGRAPESRAPEFRGSGREIRGGGGDGGASRDEGGASRGDAGGGSRGGGEARGGRGR